MKLFIAKINNDLVQINKRYWNIDQPDPTYFSDLFEANARNEQIRQTRQTLASNKQKYNDKFQSQNTINN